MITSFARGDRMNRLLAGAKLAGPKIRADASRVPYGVVTHVRPAQAAAQLTHIHDVLGQGGKRVVIPRGSRAAQQLSPVLRDGYRQLKGHSVSLLSARTARVIALAERVEAVLFKSRNSMGEFSPNDGDAIDSHTMTKAYGLPGKYAGVAGGVAAVAGGTAAATLIARKLRSKRRALVPR
ncbi:MAG: hypothetical protein QOE70_4027 [Chthoniobacter sp.]|jgi:hypothetical protein|nr:hypothetical protein [Chthoniobacter sp.]